MAAQVHRAGGREPGELVIRFVIRAGQEEGRLGKIVLAADRLQHGIVRPAFQQHDGGLIARERFVRKGIDVEVRDGGHKELPLV